MSAAGLGVLSAMEQASEAGRTLRSGLPLPDTCTKRPKRGASAADSGKENKDAHLPALAASQASSAC